MMERIPCFLLLTATILALAACAPKLEDHFERTDLPEEVVAYYGEAAAFRSVEPRDGTARVRVDLAFLTANRDVDRAVFVPYDADNWFEPIAADLAGEVATVELPVDRNVVAILDLGETARNNYRALSHMAAVRGVVPDELRPRLCERILCPAERIRFDTLGESLEEMGELPLDFEGVMPPIDLGPVPGASEGICADCFDQPPSILPCLVYRWCGDFPIPRMIHVRRNVYNLSPDEIDTLRAGVAAMKARDPSDPTSWIYQARMHALDSGVAAALQDQCQHRQFLFFSWHRMFTYYFERILRDATGDPDFALPYWNYTDIDAQRVIPEPYRIPADASNALYNGTRNSFYNGGGALPAADVSYALGFNETIFTTTSAGVTSFGGRTVTEPMHFPSPSPGSGEIEKSPHNNVHNDISGEMAAGESPRDPVFWLHHGNIDRLWNRWIGLGGGRTNPTGDSFWMSHVFNFFDENGNQVSLTGAQVLNTASQLGYRYDDDIFLRWPFEDLPILVKWPDFLPPVELVSVLREVRLGERRMDTEIPISQETRAELAATLDAEPRTERIFLQIRDIEYDEPVGISYLLFLNLPEDAERPDHTHPTFIGTLGFFGTEKGAEHGDQGHAAIAEQYDVTRALRRQGAPDRLVLTVLPSFPEAPPDRKDLQELVRQMRPKGNPRFGAIALLKARAEER